MRNFDYKAAHSVIFNSTLNIRCEAYRKIEYDNNRGTLAEIFRNIRRRISKGKVRI